MPTRTTIARLSIIKSALILAAILLAYISLYSPFISGDPIEYLTNSSRMPVMLSLVWLGGIFLLFVPLLLLRQLILRDRAAVWIEEGAVVFLHRNFSSVNVQDILEVTADSAGFYKLPVVRLDLRSGEKKLIPMALLSEQAQTVVARLREIVAATESTTKGK